MNGQFKNKDYLSAMIFSILPRYCRNFESYYTAKTEAIRLLKEAERNVQG